MALGLAVIGTAALASPASAFVLNGCKWPTKNLAIDTRDTSGEYKNQLLGAISHITLNTDVNLSGRASASAFTAHTGNWGNSGWVGWSNVNCPGGRTSNAHVYFNTNYLVRTAPALSIRSVWIHEIGHALGLAHNGDRGSIMYGGISTSGYPTTSLSVDDRRGINALY